MAEAIRVFIVPDRSSIMTLLVKSDTIGLVVPSSDTRVLIESALAGLRKCYTEGSGWIRAGIMIIDTIPEANIIPDLFATEPRPRSRELMQTLDRINRVSGAGTIRFGSEHRDIGQLLRRQYPSNRFTTSWTELPEAT